jgi:hypothetical protein
MLKMIKVFITSGDIELLEETLNLLLDYEVEQFDDDARNTVISLSRLVNDFKEEIKQNTITFDR